MKRLLPLLLICTMMVACFSGCTGDLLGQNVSNSQFNNDPVKLVVSNWPKETDGAKWEQWNRYREDFMAANPDIEIIPDEWAYDVRTYLLSAATGQVPTLYNTYYTEVDRIIAAGFARDVTEVAKERGWYDAYNDEIKDLICRNERMHLLPTNCYSMALQINKNVFEAAGLVNEDGTCMIPDSYDEVLEFSRIIQEKTDAYGFMITGGWHFMNIAWSFGTTFMENMDGCWQATFNSPACTAALQWLKDLQYEQGAFTETEGISSALVTSLFVNNKLGMTFAEPHGQVMLQSTGFDKNDLIFAAVPEGPAGRIAQMGGTIYVIDRNATDEQVEAAFRWLEFIGYGPTLTEKAKANIVAEYDSKLALDRLVGVTPPTVWKEETETRQYNVQTIKEKTNVDRNNFIHYETVDFVLHPEEPVNCQELYAILGNCIEQVLKSKDADPAEVLEKAAIEFQKDYLDEINYQ